MKLRIDRTPKSHHVGELGKSSVKQRRGWSSRKLNVSFITESSELILDSIQMVKRRKQGNPVFLHISHDAYQDKFIPGNDDKGKY
jgi:hypothetical protein